MPRKGAEWKDAARGLIPEVKSVEEREYIPDKACAKCKNFGGRHISHDGAGWCGVLKGGSNLKISPPVFVTEGESAYLTLWNMDASKCKYYDEMTFIDHSGEETGDPVWRRQYRQMAK